VAYSTPLSSVHALDGRRSVLVVEDDPMLRRAMQAQIARMNIEVFVASHYAEARACLVSMKPDLACIDIGLPTESGYELCELIRGPLGLQSMPILVTSAFGAAHEKAFAEEAGANLFLAKPFSMRELGSHVAALLDGTWPGVASMFQLGLIGAQKQAPSEPWCGAQRTRTLAATPAAMASA
jgi:DNA-binding response OmpR family regulator